ncbi:MAG: hypothetical protein RLY86_3877, partial [Pseudomonadota bacterium]
MRLFLLFTAALLPLDGPAANPAAAAATAEKPLDEIIVTANR